jgi:hypothetical protein
MALFTNFGSITGNDRLNINTTTAKGLEKVIGRIASFIISAQSKTNEILYGKYVLQGDASKNGIAKALDRGILTVLDEIASFDFCGIFSYLATQTTGKNRFNPAKEPQDKQALKLWKIQKLAFDAQVAIDKYYSTWGTSIGQDSRTGLLELVSQLNLSIDSLLAAKDGLGDPEFKVIPGLFKITNYLADTRNRFNTYTQTGVLPTSEISNLLSIIDKVKTSLIGVQALNNPAAVIGLASSLTGGSLQDQIKKLNEIATPGPKTIQFIKELIKRANNVNSVAKKILSLINTARAIIKIALLLIKVFYIIRRFLTSLPLPTMYTTTGITTTLSQVNSEVVKEKGIDKFLKRLNQINAVLNLAAVFVTSLVAAMTSLINSLRLILLNMQSCQPDLANDLQDTIDGLEDSKNQLQKFLDDANSTKNRIDNTFGGYTIEIITEELTDEGIKLKRRYGIARGGDGVIAVQSTPTFASLDLIIINEVKVLLISNGLVKTTLSDLSSEAIVTVLDSLKYIGSDDISLNNLDVTISDISALSESDDELGINSFVNNLPGGRALRKKVRKRLAAASSKLSADLKSSDPNSKYTSKIIKS